MVKAPFSLKGLGLSGESSSQRYRRLRKEGRCGWCGGVPRLGKSTCESCAKWTREIREQARQKFIREGRCHRCGAGETIVCHVIGWNSKSKKSVEQRCLKCYLQKSALQYLGTGKRWEELKKLFEKQGGKCAYTGLEITIGKDAHLDHKVPHHGKGKITDISNLQYVHYKVNLMKTGLSEEEFVDFCKLVTFNTSKSSYEN